MILFVTLWLLALSIMDIRSCRVPFWLLAIGGAGIGLAFMFQHNGQTRDCMEAIKGMIPGCLFLVIAFVTKKAGYGDGLVMLLLGMVLGLGRSMALFGISLFLTSICSLALLAFRKVRRDTKIPYLPFLTAAWLMTLNL